MITGTKEWADCRDNCILGCGNNCKYCYAKLKAIRFKRATAETWKDEKPNPKALPRKHKGRVMFPTSHDIRFEHIGWWMPHLTALLEKGNDVLIVSKPDPRSIAAICRNLYEYADNMEFRLTIGTDDDMILKFWEPDAPTYGERRHALRDAYEMGYRTSISMEPLLIRNPKFTIYNLTEYVSGTIWIGIMNYFNLFSFRTGQEKIRYQEQRKINSRENIAYIYSMLKDNPKIRWKDSVRETLGLN